MRSDFSTAPAASSPGSILLMPKSEHFSPPLPEIVGTAPAMQDVYRLVRLAAPRSANILLIGETGTGKEVIAKAVHKLSKRADGPFIRVNCGALHENLLESELFGHIKGSFTGAVENKTGRFEAAHGGTIFLDEINSTSHKLQVKLLRVLQEREFERVGESRTIRVDVRVIAATNTSLEQAVEDREFREDLYYRLNVMRLSIPPLRQRKEDIPELARAFLIRAQRQGLAARTFDKSALDLMAAYDWPGNVRELENLVLRLAVLSSDSVITVMDVEREMRMGVAEQTGASLGFEAEIEALLHRYVMGDLVSGGEGEGSNVHESVVNRVERPLIRLALSVTSGNKVRAAQLLGMNRNTLRAKINALGIAED